MNKESPKHWEWSTLGEIAQWGSGGTPSRSNPSYYNGTIPWVKTGDLNDGILTEVEEFITKEGLKHSSAKIFPKGSVAIAMYGATIGKTSILGLDAATNQACAVAQPHDGIDNRYLFYYLKSEKQEFIAKGKGGAQPNISQTVIKEHPFPLAPRDEQTQICKRLDEIFNHFDKLNNRLDSIPELVEAFKEKIFTYAVTGKLTEDWRKNNKVEETGYSFYQRVIGERNISVEENEASELEMPFEIPRSWYFSRLKNFGEVTRGKSKHRPRNDPKLFNGKYPFIQTGDVSQSGGLITKYQSTYNDIGLKQSRLFPKGTLCITIAANIAQTGILDFDACFPDSIVGYLPYKGLYSSKFVMYYFKTIQKNLEHYAPATAQKNINLNIINEILFPIPPLEEQKEIVRRVEQLFSIAELIERHMVILKQQIETFPKNILSKAFKGELIK